LAQIGLERRANELDTVELLYKDALGVLSNPREKSALSIKFARFLFKVWRGFVVNVVHSTLTYG